MKLKVKVVGADKVEQNFKKHNLIIQAKIRALISITALNIQTQAKKNTLVDTGRLRSSIRTLYKAFDGLGVEVGSDVVYAEIVEYRHKAFLNPAYEEERPKYLKELKKILKSTK